MGYAYQILHNGVDITDKITAFTISCDKDNYCREMSFDTPDIAFYNTFDFTSLAEAPSIEIKTKIEDTWYSQGTFYIEKPAYGISIKEDLVRGVWGRSAIAILGAPFATKISKTWTTDTTFFAICEEICDEMGYAWDSTYSEVSDFPIYMYTYQVDKYYPIDVIIELTTLAGAYAITDRLGNLCIKKVDFNPSVEDFTITDEPIQSIDENPSFPEFGNRIRITPSGSLAGYQITVTAPDLCLKADGASSVKVYAFVVDAEGNPVQDVIVDWEIDATDATLSVAQSNCQEITFNDENKQADSFYKVSVDYPPSSVISIYAYSDKSKTNNFADGGYTIDGNVITCTDKFSYCDQTLLVSYKCRGVATNFVNSGTTEEDVEITASISGQDSSLTFYIGNSCACPAIIDLSTSNSSIYINERTNLLVYCEEGGPITDGRKVYMSINHDNKCGNIEWGHKFLRQVSLTNWKTSVYNAISGTTQCDMPHFIQSVSSVKLIDANGAATGSDLYSSFSSKTIDLNTFVENDTDVLVNYVIFGAEVNTYTGNREGQDTITAWVSSNREEKLSDTETIQVNERGSTTNDSPPGWDPEPDMDDDDLDPEDCSGKVCKEDEVCCKVNGVIKCSLPELCDGCEHRECEEGTECCEKNKVIGCYPSDECDDDEDDFEPDTGNCYGTQCTETQSCCFVDGVVQCADPADCDTSTGRECAPSDVTSNPTEEALAGRFVGALDYGCTCEEACEREFFIYGTNQGYNENQPIPEGDDYEAKRAESLQGCLETCDKCNAPELEVTGPETIDRNDVESVSVSGGAAPYIWSVSGTGATLDHTGAESVTTNTLRTDNTACGAITVTVTDDCGNTDSWVIRCTTGQWVLTSFATTGLSIEIANRSSEAFNRIEGKYKITYSTTSCGSLTSGYRTTEAEAIGYKNYAVNQFLANPDSGCGDTGICSKPCCQYTINIPETENHRCDIYSHHEYEEGRGWFGGAYCRCIANLKAYIWTC